jgi:hypothetical protein
MYLSNNQDFDIEIEPTLFSCVLINPERDSLPLCSCDFRMGLYRQSLHRHPIRAPTTSCLGCLGWFFESVIGANSWFRVLYREGGWVLVRVVTLHYPSGCSQLFIVAEFQLILVQDPTPWRSGQQPYHLVLKPSLPR